MVIITGRAVAIWPPDRRPLGLSSGPLQCHEAGQLHLGLEPVPDEEGVRGQHKQRWPTRRKSTVEALGRQSCRAESAEPAEPALEPSGGRQASKSTHILTYSLPFAGAGSSPLAAGCNFSSSSQFRP